MRPELIEHQLTWFRCSQSSVVTMTRVTSNCTRRATGSTCNRVSSVQSDGCERGLKLIGSNGTQFVDDQLPCRPACSPPPRRATTRRRAAWHRRRRRRRYIGPGCRGVRGRIQKLLALPA